MKTLVLLIIVDIFLGILSGYINKELSSSIGLEGVIKHSVVILLNIVFKYISDIYNLESFFTLFLMFYLIQYSLSILENVYSIGVPIPTFLVERLETYKESEGLEKWKKD